MHFAHGKDPKRAASEHATRIESLETAYVEQGDVESDDVVWQRVHDPLALRTAHKVMYVVQNQRLTESCYHSTRKYKMAVEGSWQWATASADSGACFGFEVRREA